MIFAASCQPASEPAKPTLVSATNTAEILCLAPISGAAPDEPIARPHVDSTSANAWINRGRAWVLHARLSADPGFYLNVGACADQALSLEANHASALELKALVMMNMHDFAGARDLAASLVKSHPESASAFGLLADAQLELGEYDAALSNTQTQLNLRPNMAGHARASYLRWLVGDAAGARRLIVLALQDRNMADAEATAWTFVEAGNIYWNMGDLAAADAVYAEALKWVADYPAALAARGKIALAQGDHAQAIEWLSQSLKIRPLVDTAWWLGDALTAQAKTSEAAGAYAQAEAIGRRGDDLMLANFLASQKRDLDQALRLVDDDLKTRSSIYVHDARSWILYRMGRFDEALASSDAAMRLSTPDPKLIFHAGAIRLALGQREAGMRLLHQAVSLNPSFQANAVAEAKTLMSADAAPGLAAE